MSSTERENLEREFNEVQRRKCELEKKERQERKLSSLYMLPEGWREKVAAAAVECLEAGEEYLVLDLVKPSWSGEEMTERRLVSVTVRIDLMAIDYAKEEAESRGMDGRRKRRNVE